MSDENVSISVDSNEIDEAIAKLEEALNKSGQVTDQTVNAESSVSVGIGGINEQAKKDFYVIPSAEMDELNAKAAETQATVDNVVAESTAKLDAVNSEVEASKTETDDIVDSEGTKITGLESASKRVMRMIPGLREAERLQHSVGLLDAGSIMGALGLLMLAYRIYRELQSYLDQQKQQQAEYQKSIMDIRGFTSSAQFQAWQNSQSQAMRYYKMKPPI